MAADGRLTLDRSQDCTNATVYDDKAFVFSRKFQTCDPKDYAIEVDGCNGNVPTDYLLTYFRSAQRNSLSLSAMHTQR